MRMPGRTARITSLVVVLVLLAAAGVYYLLTPNGKTVTAYFTSGTALYVGNPVKMLGVPVGTVSEVEPQPDRVRVVLRLDDDIAVPADVHAAQVSPSLISGRYIAFTPSYQGGPQLADGAVIPRDRTQVPLDVNDLYRSADELAKALGPRGANKNGALSRMLRVAAKNLSGNGEQLATMIKRLAGATGTLSGSREDLSGTVRQLSTFVSTLADNDGQVRRLNKQLATVSGFLADDREELGAALKELSIALGEVSEFVRENRAALKSNVDKLNQVTSVLVKQRAALGAVLDEAPTGLSNLLRTYNAASGTLDVRTSINELRSPPLLMVCLFARRGTPEQLPDALADACDNLAGDLGGVVDLPSAGEVISSLERGETPPVPGLVLPLDGKTDREGGK